MKKFYAFAAAAMACMSMNAQLYVCGNGEGLGWNPAEPFTVEAGTDGNYTFTIDNLVQFKISSSKSEVGDANGGWAGFNAGCLVCNITEETLGTPIELTAGDANIGTPWKGEYKIVVSSDFTTLTATTTTPKPEGFKAVYIRGNMNGWGSEEAWQFATTDGKTYTFNAEGETMIAAGVTFKIADADWGDINYGLEKVNNVAAEIYPSEDPETLLFNADDFCLGEDFEGTIKFTLPEVLKDPIEVYFLDAAGVEDAIAVETEGAAEYFNLQGVRVNEPAAGLYLVRKAGKVEKVLVK